MSQHIAAATRRTIDRNPWRELRRIPPAQLGKRFITNFKDDDVPGLAAEIAYHLIFAIPPFLILLVITAALLNQFTSLPVVDNLRDLIDERAPESLQPALDAIVTNAIAQVNGGLASIGALVTAALAVWAGSNGIAVLMKVSNRAYSVDESRAFTGKKLVAIGLTLLMAVLINVAFALLIFGENIGEWIAGWVGLGSLFTTSWEIARWPTALVLFMLLLAILYHAAPDVEQSFAWISPGAVVATLLWVLALFGFKLYLQFADPGSAYGAFGSVIVFLFFLYITGMVLLVGAEVNAILHNQTVEELEPGREPDSSTEPWDKASPGLSKAA